MRLPWTIVLRHMSARRRAVDQPPQIIIQRYMDVLNLMATGLFLVVAIIPFIVPTAPPPPPPGSVGVELGKVGMDSPNGIDGI